MTGSYKREARRRTNKRVEEKTRALDPAAGLDRELGDHIERDGEIERLRAQNKAHAERRDREMADLQRRVARQTNLMDEARRRMEHAAVDWTTDPPSQRPGGWWRYTSTNNVYEVTVLVAELDRYRAALERVDELLAQQRSGAARRHIATVLGEALKSDPRLVSPPVEGRSQDTTTPEEGGSRGGT